ncbi:MAG: carboxypeptidase regulatory-like domain-containing protein, partial [Acidobacteriaceae bacterium]|nr:carboxypeptidase regulatory-like domain-containing protein [Acidobacteriaceae bacterium]
MQKRKVCEVLVACLLAVAVLLAQTPTGGIEGTVTDATGAVLPGATVTITNAGNGQIFNLKTSDAGLYSQQNLDPGTYNVRIEASGFQQTEIRNITVLTGSVANGSVS